MQAKIRAIVVDDSSLMRQVIPRILESTDEIEVVATAADAYLARTKIRELNPDVITLDVEMPIMDGLTFLEKIMTLRPTPVVMLSSLTTKSADATIKAMELGAVDFIAKPAIDLTTNLEEMSDEIIRKVKTAARSNVRARRRILPPTSQSNVKFDTTEAVIAIGASTGGVECLGRIIPQLPLNAPATVITQHMPPKFTRQFAERLDGVSSVRVREASNNKRIRPGEVWIAPGDAHLTVVRSGADYVCRLEDGPPVSGHKPSADVLFSSVAKACGSKAIGVILTGMGSDGAKGLLEMKEAGAFTIGQDEASCLVYGMPKVAFEMGAVMKQAPDQKILPIMLDKAKNTVKAMRI